MRKSRPEFLKLLEKVRDSKRKSARGPEILLEIPKISRYPGSRYREDFGLNKCVMPKGPEKKFEIHKSSIY